MTRAILVFAILSALSLGPIPAQTVSDPNPKLGFQSVGAYSISDIETINHTNGNLILQIPLASLGPDPAGVNHGVALVYNSKIWQPHSVFAANQFIQQGLQSINQTGSSTAWRYQIGYELDTTYRDLDMGNLPCLAIPPVLPETTEDIYYYKHYIVFPDGSRHLLRLGRPGDSDATHNDALMDGFYQYDIDGTRLDLCDQTHTVQPPEQGMNNPFTWYTTDGTFVRVVVTPQINLINNEPFYTWQLFFRNGDTYLGYSNAIDESLCDRNHNCVTINHQTRSAS